MAYSVKINIFEGPMDLLLHLIQKNDLDIYDIPISDITKEYLSYMELLKELNLNVAGEFLVMAASLMQIKARMLLPTENADGEQDGPDPREDLVKRLLEYRRFKEASRFLSNKFDVQRNVHYRGAPVFNSEDKVLDVSLDKLLDAFTKVLATAENEVREFMMDEIPVEVRIREILDILEKKPFVSFSELFPEKASRNLLVVSFLALLELIRLRQVRVTQTANYGDIHIQRIQSEEPVQELFSQK